MDDRDVRRRDESGPDVKILTPEEDPARDSVTFHCDVGADAVIYVYDAAGRLVHTAELPAHAEAHEWDLTMRGRPVATGLYLYAVVSYDGEKSTVGWFRIER